MIPTFQYSDLQNASFCSGAGRSERAHVCLVSDVTGRGRGETRRGIVQHLLQLHTLRITMDDLEVERDFEHVPCYPAPSTTRGLFIQWHKVT